MFYLSSTSGPRVSVEAPKQTETLSKIYVFTSIPNMFLSLSLSLPFVLRTFFAFHNCFERVFCFFGSRCVCIFIWSTSKRSALARFSLSLSLSPWNDILVIFPYLFSLSWPQQQQQQEEQHIISVINAFWLSACRKLCVKVRGALRVFCFVFPFVLCLCFVVVLLLFVWFMSSDWLRCRRGRGKMGGKLWRVLC